MLRSWEMMRNVIVNTLYISCAPGFQFLAVRMLTRVYSVVEEPCMSQLMLVAAMALITTKNFARFQWLWSYMTSKYSIEVVLATSSEASHSALAVRLVGQP